MKTIISLSFLLMIAFSSVSFAQTVETQPEFPGGEEAMMKYIQKTIRYPEEAVQKIEQGRIYIQFVVEVDGSLSEISVARGVSPSLDEEAMRVISLMPKWIPGTLNGEKVRVKYTVPIYFKLN